MKVLCFETVAIMNPANPFLLYAFRPSSSGHIPGCPGYARDVPGMCPGRTREKSGLIPPVRQLSAKILGNLLYLQSFAPHAARINTQQAVQDYHRRTPRPPARPQPEVGRGGSAQG